MPTHHSEIESINADILRRIRAAIGERGVKTSSVYRSMGRNRGWWFRLMSGKQTITAWEVVEIARALGVSPATLLPGEPRPGAPPAHPLPATIDEYIEKKNRRHY